MTQFAEHKDLTKPRYMDLLGGLHPGAKLAGPPDFAENLSDPISRSIPNHFPRFERFIILRIFHVLVTQRRKKYIRLLRAAQILCHAACFR